MNARRLVLVERTSTQEFDRFAEDRGWQRVALSIGPDDDVDADRPSTLWRTPAGSVRFVDDTVIGCQYAEPKTNDDEADLRAGFVCYDRDEAVMALDLDGSQEVVRRGYRFIAGAAIGDPAGGVIAATVRGLNHERSDVRESALIVPQYTSWTDFLPVIVQVDEQDPDPEVRRIAGGIRMLLETTAQMQS
ncbi:hypothetical protein GCM10022225_76260 [Plantactinospora mayteni]|uniref:Uncharacterized protein n=1 Tax=Plantactinospora mayteni TaxID=566021 RepID=A0ABQ4F2A8_9ACTN|nr:hypothetical protein [Plantactinospora mayteni]GIH01041.1 hypothetical protein Pma05_76130 [Plantactinospora mayteni]